MLLLGSCYLLNYPPYCFLTLCPLKIPLPDGVMKSLIKWAEQQIPKSLAKMNECAVKLEQQNKLVSK
jgi:hypothetical protein